MYEAMQEVGRLIARAGCTVATGAYGGAGMEAPVRGARECGGRIVGYTMLHKPSNKTFDDYGEVADCAHQHHLGFSGPAIPEIQYGIRLGSLLSADGFIVGAGGGPGTAVELLAFINLAAKFWEQPKKLAILHPKNVAIIGWCQAMLDTFEIFQNQTKKL